VLASFKAAGTAQIRLLFDDPTLEVWQPNYFEHVIRDEARLSRVRRYIQENPARGPDRVWSGP
jgi:REP element-mobilizing transposase RayT